MTSIGSTPGEVSASLATVVRTVPTTEATTDSEDFQICSVQDPGPRKATTFGTWPQTPPGETVGLFITVQT